MSGQIDNSPVFSLIERLGQHLQRPVSQGARERAVLHLVDWLGCAAAGAAGDAAHAARKTLRNGDAGTASVIGAGLAEPGAAAFFNGMIGNVLEMDDVDKRAILHPGPSVIPAALAMAQAQRVTGKDLLDAIVRGYEAVVRLGRAVGPVHYANWHNTGTCGPLGAAAAAASVLDLRDGQLAQALALGGSQSAGFWATRHEPASMGKQLHTAHAAKAGYDAALLAEAGFRGPLKILEGKQGFFAATCGDVDPETVMADYRADWVIHQISFKPWPACRHAHAAMDAALQLKKELGAHAASTVRAVRVQTYPDAIAFCDKPKPMSVIEAKFSLQHSVAVCLLKGKPSLADFEETSFDAPAVRELASRIVVSADEPFSSRYPVRFGARVELELSDHTTRSVDMIDAWGDPEWPLAQTDILAKADMLCRSGAGLTEPHTSAVLEAALALPHSASLEMLTEALGNWHIGRAET